MEWLILAGVVFVLVKRGNTAAVPPPTPVPGGPAPLLPNPAPNPAVSNGAYFQSQTGSPLLGAPPPYNPMAGAYFPQRGIPSARTFGNGG